MNIFGNKNKKANDKDNAKIKNDSNSGSYRVRTVALSRYNLVIVQYEPINLIFEPIYLIIFVHLSR